MLLKDGETCKVAVKLAFVIAKLKLVDGFYIDTFNENEPTICGPSSGFTLIQDLESYWFKMVNVNEMV